MATTMLDCKTIQPKLSEYVDGTLSGDTAWTIRLHLTSCAVCAQIEGDFRQTASLLRSLSAPELSPGFEAALARRLADQSLRPRPVSPWGRVAALWASLPVLPRPVYAGAAAALVAACLPVAYIATAHRAATPVAAVATPGRQVASAGVGTSGDVALDEMWNEHLTYASSEPLGDSAALLPARAGARN